MNKVNESLQSYDVKTNPLPLLPYTERQLTILQTAAESVLVERMCCTSYGLVSTPMKFPTKAAFFYPAYEGHHR
jgi:hypothetical protein